MQRIQFIKTLGLGASGLIIPKNEFLNLQKVKIYDNYLSGLRFYHYPELKTQIKEGDSLLLQRESTNTHDHFAIEVFYAKKKIGYLRAYENIVLANMLEQGVKLQTVVSKHQRKTDYQYRLSIAIFTELVLPSDLLIKTLQENQRADDMPDSYRNNLP